MSYLDNFEDEPFLDEGDWDDDDEDWTADDPAVEGFIELMDAEAMAKAGWKVLGHTSDEDPFNSELAPKDREEFLALLLARDPEAIAVVAAFMEAYRRANQIQEVHHTLWVGQETTDGFFVYHVNHDMNTSEVLVTLDSTELFTYSVKDANTVVVVCPEALFGVDVEVRRK